MFYSTVVLAAAAAFSGLVAAQSGNSTVTIDPNSVPIATRQTWCRAQTQTCPQLCEDQRTTPGGNICDSNTLTYNCTCASDMESPAVADYQQTLPALLCEQYVIQCVAANPNDLDAQTACHSTNCGNKTLDDRTSSSSSSSESASATSSSTRSASGSGASETASSTLGGDSASSTAEASASSTADASGASGLNIASTGALVVGILAAFGFAL